MKRKPSQYVCQRCWQPVHLCFFGWKHCTGWHSGPTCGQRPIPIERDKLDTAIRLSQNPVDTTERKE